MKKNLFLLFFVLVFSCVLSAETSLFIDYLSDDESEFALSVIGRIEIKDEVFRLIDVNGEVIASCDLYEVRKIVFQESSVITNVDDLDMGSIVAVYPNPAQNVLFVEGLNSNDIVRIYDLNGNLILIETVVHRVRLMFTTSSYLSTILITIGVLAVTLSSSIFVTLRSRK